MQNYDDFSRKIFIAKTRKKQYNFICRQKNRNAEKYK